MAPRRGRPGLIRLGPGLLALLLAGCARAQASVAGTAALDSMKARLQDAFVHKDARAIAAFFASDAVVLTPNGELLEGSEKIAAAVADLLPRVRGYSISTRHVESSDKLAYDQETYGVLIARGDEKTDTVAGHQIVVVRQQPDGSWRIVESGAWTAPPATMPDMPGMTP